MLGHDRLGHPLVGLVLEVHDRRGRASGGASCRRSVATAPGLVRAHLVDDGVEGERLLAQPERAAADRRDQRHLVAVRELVLPLAYSLFTA